MINIRDITDDYECVDDVLSACAFDKHVDIKDPDASVLTDMLRHGGTTFSKYVGRAEEEFSRTIYGNMPDDSYEYKFTNSGTNASFLFFILLREKYGKCLVLVPSNTFVSPMQTALHSGHDIMIMPCSIDDGMMSAEQIKRVVHDKKITDRYSKVVVFPTLIGGISYHGGLNSKLKELRESHGIIVGYDAAQSYRVHESMEFDFAIHSFFPTKPIKAINGGCLVTDMFDRKSIDVAANMGRTNCSSQFGYLVSDVGQKIYMDSFNARILLTSMAQVDDDSKARLCVASVFVNELKKIGYVTSQDVGRHSSNYYLHGYIPNFANLYWEMSDDCKRFIHKHFPYHYPPLTEIKTNNNSIMHYERVYNDISSVTELTLNHSWRDCLHIPINGKAPMDSIYAMIDVVGNIVSKIKDGSHKK